MIIADDQRQAARLAVMFRRALAARGRAVRFRQTGEHVRHGNWQVRVRGQWIAMADADLRAQVIRFLEDSNVDHDGRRLPFVRGPIVSQVLDALRRAPP
jgi:hypothetical protein